MKKPDLCILAQWLDPDLVATLESRRRLKKEWHRRRKLATLETLWLMLAVSLDTQRSGLFEILRLATGQLGIEWSISVAAFCKARARFSPAGSLLVLWQTGIAAAKSLQGRHLPLARIATPCRGQNNSRLARISTSFQSFRCTQWPAGIGGHFCRALLLV